MSAGAKRVVDVERSGERYDIVLARGDRANALDTDAAAQLRDAFESVPQGVKVVVLRAEGKHFCAGADLDEMKDLDAIGAEQFIRGLHLAFRAIRQLPQPVIAEVRGVALGAGLEMLVSCDLSVCAESAVLGMPEPLVGLPSVIEAALLPGIVGLSRARELLYLGENIEARRAYEIGLVNVVVPDEEVEAKVDEWAQKLIAHPREAMSLQKQLMRRWLNVPMDEAIEAGVQAFTRAMASEEPGRVMHALRSKDSQREEES